MYAVLMDGIRILFLAWEWPKLKELC